MRGVEDSNVVVPLGWGPTLGGSIVVATDGTHNSDGAVRVGLELSRQHDIPVELISVVEATDFIEYEGSAPADIERATRFALLSRDGELTAQRLRTGTVGCAVPSTIKVGRRVDEIVEFAEQHDAALIVTGAGSQGVLARLLHRHTVTRLAAVSPIPVLAVPSDDVSLGNQRLFCVSLASEAGPQQPATP
jgi:nucleotide-binding universal stress UspA family protein